MATERWYPKKPLPSSRPVPGARGSGVTLGLTRRGHRRLSWAVRRPRPQSRTRPLIAAARLPAPAAASASGPIVSSSLRSERRLFGESGPLGDAGLGSGCLISLSSPRGGVQHTRPGLPHAHQPRPLALLPSPSGDGPCPPSRGHVSGSAPPVRGSWGPGPGRSGEDLALSPLSE